MLNFGASKPTVKGGPEGGGRVRLDPHLDIYTYRSKLLQSNLPKWHVRVIWDIEEKLTWTWTTQANVRLQRTIKIAFNIFISTIFVNLIIMELDFLRESASNQSSACICGTSSPKCKCLKNTCASSGTNEIWMSPLSGISGTESRHSSALLCLIEPTFYFRTWSSLMLMCPW